MATSNTPTPTQAVDVTAVLDAKLVQLFPQARALRVETTPEAKLMEHPLETGATIVDHRVVLPLVVTLSMILASQDYAAVFNQIRDLFGRGELLTVQTRVGSYPNMVIEKIPHEETEAIFDGVTLTLTLREALFAVTQFAQIKVARPRDSNTQQRGQQQPKESPPQQGGSLAARIADALF